MGLKNKPNGTNRLVYFSIFVAIVLILQIFGGTIKLGAISINLVLIPLILCGYLLGSLYALLLGVIIGIVILFCGIVGIDTFTNVLFSYEPFAIILICILKTALAGLISSLIYSVLKNRNELVAVIVSACVAPIINTGVFVLGMLLINGTLADVGFIDGGENVFIAIVTGLVTINFVFEFALNVIVAPAIYKVIKVIGKVKK